MRTILTRVASLSCAVSTAAALAAAGAGHARAQADAPGVASVDVTIRTRDGRALLGPDAATFPVGDQVVICFTPSRDGFVTVWAKEVDAPGVSLLYPNRFASPDRLGIPVVAGEETCIGEPGDDFVLRAQPPAGVNEIAVAWTASEDDQLTEADFANPSAHAGGLAIGTIRFTIED